MGQVFAGSGIGKQAGRLGSQDVRVAQRAVRGAVHELIIGHRAPDEVRELRCHLPRVQLVPRGAVVGLEGLAQLLPVQKIKRVLKYIMILKN